MRSKWVGYAAALLFASAVVAASLFAPAALLTRRVSSLLGDVLYTDYGNYPARTLARTPEPSPSPSAQPSAPADLDRTESITRKFQLFERNREPADLPVTPPYDMDMMTAVSRCRDLIKEYMEAAAMPPLTNFPEGYPQLYATLHTIADPDGGESFDYWAISFTGDPNQKRLSGSISVMLDARTGAIYSIKMYSTSVLKTFHIEDSAEYIADFLRVTGTVKPTQTEPESGQSAIWISREKTLFISFYYTASASGSSFAMACSVHSPT
jgi:hypothetical protein